MKTALVLTLHRINLGIESSPQRYTISTGLFEQIVNMVPHKKCCTVSEYVDKQDKDWLILTFDDGYLSDYEIVFPVLMYKGLKATFFVNSENIDQPGYLCLSHLKEMAKAGMEIGSHGLTHRYLITMDPKEAHKEIKGSKEILEQRIGTKICSFAPVGGHYKSWMIDLARQAGYCSFVTMIPGKTNGGGEITLLRRNHIQSHHNARYVSCLINGNYNIFLLNRLQYRILQIPKIILGIENYDHLKRFILNTITHLK